jgi:hypothetical protein
MTMTPQPLVGKLRRAGTLLGMLNCGFEFKTCLNT